MAVWVLTRNRPTGPRRGTSVLVMGAASVIIAALAIAGHFWVDGTTAAPVIVLLVRLALVLGLFVWAGLTIAVFRDERRRGERTHGAIAGLVLLSVATIGALLAMAPGIADTVQVLR